jgi:hypothetical protein
MFYIPPVRSLAHGDAYQWQFAGATSQTVSFHINVIDSGGATADSDW